MRRFLNRTEAGQLLARMLEAYVDRPDVVVLALPRGGVPVAFEIAQSLHAPLDVFLVRKLGVPSQPELAMGAIATGGICVLNHHVVRSLHISDGVLNQVLAEEQQELVRRTQLYRGDRPDVDVKGRTVILVDDGLATGSTMRAALTALRQQQPTQIVVAVPVGPAATCEELKSEVDEMICALTPEPFHAVGLGYKNFSQTADAEVRELLQRASQIQPVA